MERERYLELLGTDGRLLLRAAAGDLTAAVATCPGWTVADLLAHTAEVYEHKLRCIQLAGVRPDPWPPTWPGGRNPLEWCADAHARLLEVLAGTDSAAPSWTWWPRDQTAGFWVRRMAQETAVHRVDAQSARGQQTAVDAELARDGIDEVLTMMLAGDWSDEPQPGSSGTVLVGCGDHSWQAALSPGEVVVTPPDGRDDAQVRGESSAVLLWLWGRLADVAVELSGDLAAVGRLRDRLALATQ